MQEAAAASANPAAKLRILRGSLRLQRQLAACADVSDDNAKLIVRGHGNSSEAFTTETTWIKA